jgi:UDP-N-acetylmuramoylalanine--D-glutamate ligase
MFVQTGESSVVFQTVDIKEKKVVVVGLARSGVAAANKLKAMGAHVFVTDSKERAVLQDALEELSPGIEVETGVHSEKTFDRADLIVVSPGVPMSIAPLIKARSRGLDVISEVELAYRICPGRHIGITGTNGKSTTTELLGEMFRKAGRPVLVGGNIGTPLTGLVDQATDQSTFVVELSSFQLEGIDTYRPQVAVLLNITPDHLDRYPGMEEYAHAKARIFQNQTSEDVAVINRDDPWVMVMTNDLRSTVVPFSLTGAVEGGIYCTDRMIISTLPVFEGVILSVEEIRIQGIHNMENAMAASASALISGCDVESVRSALKTFAGLPHRMEFVGEINGVQFVNDSKGTNIGAVSRSVKSLPGAIHLIAGGQGKKTSYHPLREMISESVQTLILIGEAAEDMEKDLKGATEIRHAETMREAVRIAFKRAQSGEYVLLSPACASFDMFENFEERGRTFEAEVQSLKSEGT